MGASFILCEVHSFHKEQAVHEFFSLGKVRFSTEHLLENVVPFLTRDKSFILQSGVLFAQDSDILSQLPFSIKSNERDSQSIDHPQW